MWGAINNLSSGLKDLTTKGLERAQVLLEKLDERLGDDYDDDNEDNDDDNEDNEDADNIDSNNDNSIDQTSTTYAVTGNESEQELLFIQQIEKLKEQLSGIIMIIIIIIIIISLL